MCAVLTADGAACDQNAWDPNSQMLDFAADGQGGQVPAGTSIQLVSAHFQGALYGTHAVTATTTSQTQGPIIAGEVVIGQSNNISFPTITIVPVGMPGNEIPPPTLGEAEVG